MSYCKQEGKDRIIFVTKEDHETPSNAELIAEDPNDPYEEQGLILPNGDINWNCPCLGGMASGPCGTQFKEAFSCFHYSQEEVKGSECLGHFRDMQECMQRYPELYPKDDEDVGGSGAPGDQPDDASAAAPPTAADSTSTTPASDIAPAAAPPTPEPDSTTSDSTAAPVDGQSAS